MGLVNNAALFVNLALKPQRGRSGLLRRLAELIAERLFG
jgi:hypothetical protein